MSSMSGAQSIDIGGQCQIFTSGLDWGLLKVSRIHRKKNSRLADTDTGILILSYYKHVELFLNLKLFQFLPW